MKRLAAVAFLAVAGLAALGASSIESTEAPAAVPGTIRGRVVVSAPPPPPPATLSPYARRRYQPPQDPGVPGGAEDAFVYLERLDGPMPVTNPEPLRILQRDRTIIPYASVARVGQLVEFPNEDDIYHNLFSLSTGNRFSLGRYAPGVTETNVFENPGVVRLFCDIHSEMAGVILVIDTPYVTRVDADGSYELPDVPAGEYRAIAWHPTAGADTASVSVQESAPVARDFMLTGTR